MDCSILSNRLQITRVKNTFSKASPINKGIVQGSGIGPTLFSIMISDLKCLSSINDLFKYADDTTMLSPENTDVDFLTEFLHIQDWAVKNKMVINMEKTKELVFRRPNPRCFICPAPIVNIVQVSEIKLLGVLFSSNFKFDSHVKFLLSQCNQRSYLLRQLHSQGLSSRYVHIVFDAIVISRFLYALSVWGGFLSSELVGQINSFFKRMFRYGHSKKLFDFNDLLVHSDYRLFSKMQISSHCMHQVLPCQRSSLVDLRSRGHPYMLPTVSSTAHKKSFVIRCLYDFI